MPQAKAGGRDKSDVGSRSGRLPRSDFRIQRPDVRTRSGRLPRLPKDSWFTKPFPAMRKVKIRRNQSRGGTPCPPEGGWVTKLFPAVLILKIRTHPLPPLTRVIPRGAGKCPRSGQRGRPPSGAGEPNAMRRDWGRDKSEQSGCYAPFLRTARRFSPVRR